MYHEKLNIYWLQQKAANNRPVDKLGSALLAITIKSCNLHVQICQVFTLVKKINVRATVEDLPLKPVNTTMHWIVRTQGLRSIRMLDYSERVWKIHYSIQLISKETACSSKWFLRNIQGIVIIGKACQSQIQIAVWKSPFPSSQLSF
jgi:hypothetical protein